MLANKLSSSSKLAIKRGASLRSHCRGFNTQKINYAVTHLNMPSMSPTMTEGSIAKWLVKEGASYSQGDVLLEIETDKAQIEVEAPEDGILAKILKNSSSGKIAVGQPIALTAEEGDDLNNLEIPETTDAPAASVPKNEEAPVAKAATPAATSSGSRSTVLSPAVGHLLSNYGIKDPLSITATGPHGRLLKGDVLSYISANKLTKAKPQSAKPSQPKTQSPAPVQSTSAGYTDIPTTNMRRVIAQRLSESKSTIHHAYTSRSISMQEVNVLRSTLKRDHDIKVSVNDFVIRACALALNDVPAANVRYNPNLEDGIEQVPDIDISIAVATPTGLITPIVKHANHKGLRSISQEVKDLATRAKINKLKPNEYQGGSFSISNLGMFGIKQFTAIINPPQACILAVSAAHEELTPTETSFSSDIFDELIPSSEVPASPKSDTVSKDILDELIAPTVTGALPASLRSNLVMTVTLSSDARVVDGQVAAELLSRIEYYLSNPQNMIL